MSDLRQYSKRLRIAVLLGIVPIALIAMAAGRTNGVAMAAALDEQAEQAISRAGGAPVSAHFVTSYGWASRHPLLTGGEQLNAATRDRVAKAVAAIPAVGGVRWADGSAQVESAYTLGRPLHCEEDVQALLRARSIRFEEGSARIHAGSAALLDEVAGALSPCLGSIIAVSGHTDSTGPEAGNLELSQARAQAVRQALIGRGIPADGLRTRGLGSREPVEGLDPTDPANRRIEFSVLSISPIKPTPVDTPGPH
jgi:OOP family OmpA-OmpF porin